MGDLTDLQASQSIKLAGVDPSTGLENYWAFVDQYGSQVAFLKNSSGVEIATQNNGTANQQLLGTLTPDTTTATVALNALNAAITVATAGLTGVGFQILAGTLIGTIIPEFSIDGGTTWFPASFYDNAQSSLLPNVIFSVNNTTKMLTVITLGGTSHVRVRVSAYTSGTANALMRVSHGVNITITPAGATGGAAAYGTVTNTFVTIPNNTATLILAANPSRKYAYISNNSGSGLSIQFGSPTGLTATTGLTVGAKTYYELKGDNLFTGNVYGFSTSGIIISLAEGTP